MSGTPAVQESPMAVLRLVKKFNNNVLLVADEAEQLRIVTGRGLAFGVERGDVIAPEKIGEIFVPTGRASADRMAGFLVDLPPEHVSLAATMLESAAELLGVDLGRHHAIPLADHLTFALTRHRDGIGMEYPMQAEVPHLFPGEHRAARDLLDLVAAETGVRLPDSEAVPIALHLVNAQLETADLPETFRLARLLDQIFEVLGAALGAEVDRESINTARFLTHLRYFFVRHASGDRVAFDQGPLAAAIREQVPDSYRAALKVKPLLELRLAGAISDAEIAYLAVHIARLDTRPPRTSV